MNFRVLLFSCVMALVTLQASAQKIGLLMDSYVIDRWYLDQKLFTDKVKELGGEVIVEVPYGDPDEQVKLGRKLIEQKVDVLVIVPTDAKKAAEIVKEAKAAGIPVIAYDRLIISRDLSFYISYNNLKVGNLQAEYALRKVPKGKYLIMNGPTSDNNAILFRKGQMQVLQPSIDKGDITVVADYVLNDWSEIEALMKLDEFFGSNEVHPDVIIAANDALANGCIQSLPKEQVGKTLITGQDADLLALKNIISGNQSMTIYKPIKPLAHGAAMAAMALAKGEKIQNKTVIKSEGYEIEAILLDPIVVDKENCKDTVVKDGHVTLSELYQK